MKAMDPRPRHYEEDLTNTCWCSHLSFLLIWENLGGHSTDKRSKAPKIFNSALILGFDHRKFELQYDYSSIGYSRVIFDERREVTCYFRGPWKKSALVVANCQSAWSQSVSGLILANPEMMRSDRIFHSSCFIRGSKSRGFSTYIRSWPYCRITPFDFISEAASSKHMMRKW